MNKPLLTRGAFFVINYSSATYFVSPHIKGTNLGNTESAFYFYHPPLLMDWSVTD